MPKKKKPTRGGAKSVVLGASLAGLAATTYFLFGPNKQKNQKQAKAWALKMKADVVEKLEVAKQISQSAYHEIIDSVAVKHAKQGKVNPDEVKALAQDLKKHWSKISPVVPVAKKVVTKKPVRAKK